jgi:hypothetical protein
MNLYSCPSLRGSVVRRVQIQARVQGRIQTNLNHAYVGIKIGLNQVRRQRHKVTGL